MVCVSSPECSPRGGDTEQGLEGWIGVSRKLRARGKWRCISDRRHSRCKKRRVSRLSEHIWYCWQISAKGVSSDVGQGSERWAKVKDSSGDQARVGLVVPVRRRGSLWQMTGATNGFQTGPL